MHQHHSSFFSVTVSSLSFNKGGVFVIGLVAQTITSSRVIAVRSVVCCLTGTKLFMLNIAKLSLTLLCQAISAFFKFNSHWNIVDEEAFCLVVILIQLFLLILL